MVLDDAPERLRKVVRMWEDEYEHGEEFDYMGVTMVRAETPKPLYYPKQVGKQGLINVNAIPSATLVEEEIQKTISFFDDE